MNATPFFIALLACIWLKEIITFVEVITMLGAFGGIILVGISKTSATSGAEIS
jgi:drug/metabolite transporter (DMT)-like permease